VAYAVAVYSCTTRDTLVARYIGDLFAVAEELVPAYSSYPRRRCHPARRSTLPPTANSHAATTRNAQRDAQQRAHSRYSRTMMLNSGIPVVVSPAQTDTDVQASVSMVEMHGAVKRLSSELQEMKLQLAESRAKLEVC
jgi:hypothetical protein